jgi:NAD(P)-dependent dehydrogenase (short-subunit alcohol dehydrogenase family)
MVASAGQQAIDFGDVMLTRDYTGVRAYRQSKLAQIMMAFDLAEPLARAGVTINALHPVTYMPTKIVRLPVSTLEEGVEATLRLVVGPDLVGSPDGTSTAPGRRAPTPRPTTRRPERGCGNSARS